MINIILALILTPIFVGLLAIGFTLISKYIEYIFVIGVWSFAFYIVFHIIRNLRF